ncbi:hypothetical protein E5A73_17740 [Sphingomonas gei]|uniref:Uncharacterized protein n=1 Tax=Sphingomonas gei TaxID=1395960 RepID=A0A4S1X3E9_9SPHN|nr:hypothetical protein [Sphingomonas gei]TGX50263.1 hypothetical protein E5A73_17740 [Sphingomonas gei]
MASYPHGAATQKRRFAVKVDDVEVGAHDRAGDVILQVYSVVVPRYAVYRTEKRVMVHYSDDGAEQAEQEKRIGQLYAVRGQISSLIDGWRAEEDVRNSKGARVGNGRRAARYDRRIADALLLALQGNVPAAIELLNGAKNDIVSERQSIARIDYLWTAMAVTGFFVLLMAIISSGTLYGVVHRLGPPYASVWTAVSGGTMGAFFSIATGLNTRTILIDLQNRNNRADAALRVMIGAISGGMLLCLLSSGLAANSLIAIGTLNETSVKATLLVFVLGFLAGFAERLLPDLLEKAKLGLEDDAPTAPKPSGGGATPGAGAGGGGGGAELPVTVTPVAAPTPEGRDAEASGPVDDPDAPVADESGAAAPPESVGDPESLAPSVTQVDDPDAASPLASEEGQPVTEEPPARPLTA